MDQQSVVLTPQLVVLKLIEVKNLIVKNWIALLIITAIGGSIGFYKDSKLKQRAVYSAEIIFSMSGGVQNDMNGLGSLLGMGQPADVSMFSGENFLYIVKTRSTIEKALLTKVTFKGKTDYFANFYIDSSYVRQDDWTRIHQVEDKWGEVHFTQPNRSKMTKTERSVLDHLYDRIYLETEIIKPDLRLVFLKLQGLCEYPTTSKLWAETLLGTIEEIYSANQTKKTRKTMALMQHRVDSLGRSLNRSEGSIARLVDINKEAVMIEGQVQQTRMTRNNGLTNGLYQEAVRNLETLKLTAIKESAFINVVEPIHEPLVAGYFGRTFLKFGIAIGFLVGIIFIVLRQVYRDALTKVKPTT